LQRLALEQLLLLTPRARAQQWRGRLPRKAREIFDATAVIECALIGRGWPAASGAAQGD